MNRLSYEKDAMNAYTIIGYNYLTVLQKEYYERQPREKVPQTAKGFEETLRKIEGIVEEIESGEMPLDQVVDRFQSATTLITQCRSMLEDVELEIEVMESKVTKKIQDSDNNDKLQDD